MCVRVQRSESHIHPQSRSTSELSLPAATGYAEIIESILWLDNYNYGYGTFVHLKPYLCCQLRLALSTNDRLPIEFKKPAKLPHDSRAVVCLMNPLLLSQDIKLNMGVIVPASLLADTMDGWKWNETGRMSAPN